MDNDDSAAVLVTASVELSAQTLAAAAAAGVNVRVCSESTDLGTGAPPRTLLVGADQMALVARHPLVSRSTVHLLGTVADRERMCEWSAALGASVIVLPEGSRWLTAALAGSREAVSAPVLGIVGGSGGVGTSTLAAGVAWAAARRGHRVALVDLDPRGGGLDSLLGIESEPGWRWPALAAADGFLGDLHDHVPRLESLAVVSHLRHAPAEISTLSALAVVRSLVRTHDLVVLDAGTRPGPVEREVLRAGDGVLLVCASDVRSLTAATQQLRLLDAHLPQAAVLSRTRPGGHGAEAVHRALRLPVAATLPADRRVAAALDRGEPPGQGAGRAWRQCCARILDGMLSHPLAAPRGSQDAAA